MDSIHTELRPCGDCAVPPGSMHEDGCDVARCAFNGYQRLQCDHPGDACNTVWTGLWPGTEECIEYGWYTRWTDHGWESCTKDAEGAQPDLNRLGNPFLTVWDRDRQRFVPRASVAS